MKIKNYKLKIRNYHHGQVAIVVLLISAVMLTLGLSLSKKSTVETKIDTNEELLKEAFNTAESGINYYLGTGITAYSVPGGVSSANLSIKDIGGGDVLDFGEFVPRNGSEFYWLVNHNDDGSLGTNYYGAASVDLCRGNFVGAIKVDYFYKSGADYGVLRSGYNFGNVSNLWVNGFTNSSNECVNISTPNSPVLLAITPFFNGGRFHLESIAPGVFPIQGIEINSRGRAGEVPIKDDSVGGVGAGTKINSSSFVNKSLTVNRRYIIPSFLLSGVVAEDSVLSQ